MSRECGNYLITSTILRLTSLSALTKIVRLGGAESSSAALDALDVLQQVLLAEKYSACIESSQGKMGWWVVPSLRSLLPLVEMCACVCLRSHLQSFEMRVTAWKKCFDLLLLPLLVDVSQYETSQATSAKKSGFLNVEKVFFSRKIFFPSRTGSQQQLDIKLRISSLLFSVFLHHLEKLASLPDFHIFWLKFIGVLERYMKRKSGTLASGFRLRVRVDLVAGSERFALAALCRIAQELPDVHVLDQRVSHLLLAHWTGGVFVCFTSPLLSVSGLTDIRVVFHAGSQRPHLVSARTLPARSARTTRRSRLCLPLA